MRIPSVSGSVLLLVAVTGAAQSVNPTREDVLRALRESGATLNLRTRTKNGKLYLTQRDLGTSFAMRFLAAYDSYRFGEKH